MARPRLPGPGALYLVLLTALLVMPADADWHAHRENRWLPARFDDMTTRAVVRDFVANIAIFVPVGFIVGRRWRRRPALSAFAFAVLAAAVFSFVTESVQFLLAWRASSLLDVVANTLGAALGAAMVTGRRQAVRASAPSNTGLSVRSTRDSSPSVGSCSE